MNKAALRGPVHNYAPGTRYGRLVVVSYTPGTKAPAMPATLRARCDCGTTKDFRWPLNIVRGHVTSCGCASIENRMKRKHGMVGTRTHNIWTNMTQRCHNPNATGYAYYGAKGVVVCRRWREKFTNFLEDMGPCPTDKHTIDRINPYRSYSPRNCRWVPRAHQARTTRMHKRGRGMTEAKVRQVRALHARGVTAKTLALQFNVAVATIRDVVKKRSWADVT